jgi:hypothetical protein
MQYVLQKYTLYTCHESAQNGPPIVCFHPLHVIDNRPTPKDLEVVIYLMFKLAIRGESL